WVPVPHYEQAQGDGGRADGGGATGAGVRRWSIRRRRRWRFTAVSLSGRAPAGVAAAVETRDGSSGDRTEQGADPAGYGVPRTGRRVWRPPTSTPTAPTAR
ncbi:unnamed protein product, partial [Ectocarpus fasciculatus]